MKIPLGMNNMDRLLVYAAFDEFYGENAHLEYHENFIRTFMDMNIKVLEKCMNLIPKMQEEANQQTGLYNQEPYEVFLLSAPQHFKDEFVGLVSKEE